MKDEWDRVDALISGLLVETSKVTAVPRVKALYDAALRLRTEFLAEKAAGNDTVLPRLGQAVRGLWAEVELATGLGPKRKLVDRFFEQFGVGAIFGVLILLLAFGGVAYLILEFIKSTPSADLQTAGGMRPILTLASVIATLAFGGGLVFAALFSSEGAFENRFRMAREIFLVFSGVFATVVGFHFGKSDEVKTTVPQSKQEGASLLAASISDVLASEKDGKLYLAIVGGTPPYQAEVDIDGIKKTAKGSSPLVVDLGGLDLTKPVAVLSVVITDDKKNKKELSAKKVTLKDYGKNTKTPDAASPPASAASS